MAATQEKIGAVTQIVKGPNHAQNTDGVMRTLAQDDPVYLHDTVTTSAGSYVKVTLNDGSLFQLGPLARASLDQYSYAPSASVGQQNGQFETSITTGLFRFMSGKISEGNQGQHTVIKTPSANIGVRGSEIDGNVDDNGTTVLHISGLVDVRAHYQQQDISVYEPGTKVYIPNEHLAVTVIMTSIDEQRIIREQFLPLNTHSTLSVPEDAHTNAAKAVASQQTDVAETTDAELNQPDTELVQDKTVTTIENNEAIDTVVAQTRDIYQQTRDLEPQSSNEEWSVTQGISWTDSTVIDDVVENYPEGTLPITGEVNPPVDQTPLPDDSVDKPTPPDSTTGDVPSPNPPDTTGDNVTPPPVNLPPLAADDWVAMGTENRIVIAVADLLRNDTDPNRDPLTLTGISNNYHGSVVLTTSGHEIVFTRDAYFDGKGSFTYTISDGHGGQASAIVNIDGIVVPATPSTPTYTSPPNLPPVLVNDNLVFTIQDSVTIPSADLLRNDYDPDGDPLSITRVMNPSHGTVTLDALGNITFARTPSSAAGVRETPPTDERGGFDYVVSDGHGHDMVGHVELRWVEAPNRLPQAHPDPITETVPKNTPVIIPIASLLANDVDPDVGDTLTLNNVISENGPVSQDGHGNIVFTPTVTGLNSFSYTVSDGHGAVSPPVTVTVNAVNLPPIATADGSVSTPVNTPLNLTVTDLLENDSDPNQDAIAITEVKANGPGQIVLTPEGIITFTPAPDFRGPTTFDYILTDSDGARATATVPIIVGTNVAHPDEVQTLPGTPVTIPVAELLKNDSPLTDSPPPTLTAIRHPIGGTADLDPVAGTVTFTPDPTVTGQATFEYEMTDAEGRTATTTVTVNIDKPPVAKADGTQEFNNVTAQNTPLTVTTIELLRNDSDADGDALTVVAVDNATHGQVNINADGDVLYQPKLGFSGNDSFTYTVADEHGAKATAEVSVRVNTPPLAVADGVDTPWSTPQNTAVTIVATELLRNDSDADGDVFTVTAVGTAQHGQVTLNSEGNVVYTPNPDFGGTDELTYTIADTFGDSSSATVAVTVTATSQLPVAVDDTAATTSKNTPLTMVASDLLSNDQGDNLSIDSITTASHGQVVLDQQGSVVYTPNQDFVGADQFNYTLVDAHGHTASATVTLTVIDNALPVGTADNVNTLVDVPLTLAASDLLSNDGDADGDTLTITQVGPATHGQVILTTDTGNVVYTPNPGFMGTDSFSYTLDDGHSGQATTTVNVTVDNAPPVANPDSLKLPLGIATTITAAELLANDVDPNSSDVLQVTQITQSSPGVEIVFSNNEIQTYIEALQIEDIEALNFDYVVTDSHGATATATVSLQPSNVINGSGDNITGTGADDIVVGSSGDDSFALPVGADVLLGGDGNDIFLFDLNAMIPSAFNGQAGQDSLVLVGTGQMVNLLQLNRMASHIDVVDLRESYDTQLRLSVNDVLSLSDEGRLIIEGNASTTVYSMGTGWVNQGQIGSYYSFTNGGAELLVSIDVGNQIVG